MEASEAGVAAFRPESINGIIPYSNTGIHPIRASIYTVCMCVYLQGLGRQWNSSTHHPDRLFISHIDTVIIVARSPPIF